MHGFQVNADALSSLDCGVHWFETREVGALQATMTLLQHCSSWLKPFTTRHHILPTGCCCVVRHALSAPPSPPPPPPPPPPSLPLALHAEQGVQLSDSRHRSLSKAARSFHRIGLVAKLCCRLTLVQLCTARVLRQIKCSCCTPSLLSLLMSPYSDGGCKGTAVVQVNQRKT